MPLARRMSNSSVASASSRQSFPATVDSSTKVSKAKVGKIMSRRKSRRQATLVVDKENGENNLLQSPTPYWKVVKERGGVTTPPETRSTKKLKKDTGAKKLDFSPNDKPPSGVLMFSPPDQKANARREKAEIEQKEKARASRVRKARDSGQLLVFSPTMRNPAPLPAEATEEERQIEGVESMDEDEAQSNVENPNESSVGEEDDEDETVSPTNMEVEVVGHGSEKSQVSLVTAHSNAHNESITQELKNLRETIHKLVDRKSNSDEVKQHNISLEAHMIRTEKVLLENSKLESKIEKLEETMKEMETKSAEEKERLVSEMTRMESDLETATQDAQSNVEALEGLKKKMEDQLEQSQSEKANLLEQIMCLKGELEESRSRLAESKDMLQALKDELVEERKSMAEEQEELRNLGSDLEMEIKELSKANASLKEAMISYEKKIDTLENSLLPESEEQLQKAQEKVNRFEQREDELRGNMIQLEQKIDSLKKELSQIRGEQEEERNHFQELNEESSKAYEQMKKNLQEKDELINDLKSQVEETSTFLASESQKMKDTSEELHNVRASMDARAEELEMALEDATRELEESTKEKKVLEGKLAAAIEQMEEKAAFKEEVLARSNETSAANQLLQKRILQLEQALQLSNSECNEAKQRAETFNERETELYKKLQESDRVRRGLHNRVMQLSGNIRVYVRVRPMLPGEKDVSKPSQSPGNKKRKHDELEEESPFHYPGMGGHESEVKSSFGADDPTKNLLEVTEPWRDRGGLSERRKKWKFGFDNVFTPHHDQQDIWEATEPLVQSAVDGYNVTVFAYGQTGSGKTFTMLGEPGQEGIVARSVRKLFAAKEAISELTRGESRVEISVELLEVYNEKVRDLLDSSKPDGEGAALKVKANEAIGSIVVPTNSEAEVASILETAQSRRCVKATASNAVSSRSHMLFTIYFKVTGRDGSSRVGKLNVCDLAGSERLGKSNANEDVGGALLKETKHINTSLSVLSNVIEKLQAGDSNVPYRESKLTHLLQNSLGGNSKTLAIVCCNPLQSHFHESLCSLRFAAKVNKVDLKAVANFSA